MSHVINEKWKKTNNGRNRIAKLKNNQNAWRKRNLLVPPNIESRHHQTSGDERKKKLKRVSQTNEKTSLNDALLQESYQRDKHLGYLKEELRQMDLRTRKLMMHKALHPRVDIDYMFLEKKEKEVSLASKIAWIHQYDNIRNSLKSAKKDQI